MLNKNRIVHVPGYPRRSRKLNAWRHMILFRQVRARIRNRIFKSKNTIQLCLRTRIIEAERGIIMVGEPD